MKSLIWFTASSFILGTGLAADAFSVSVVNGTADTGMKTRKAFRIAFTFALFQAIMPLTGWFMSNKLIYSFKVLKKFVPPVSQILLLYLGIKIIADGRSKVYLKEEERELDTETLLLQALATSVDALLAGLAIADYGFVMALVCSLIIAGVTFVLCFTGVHLGKGLGIKLAGKAPLIGGCMLIFIAVVNFIQTVL